MIRTYEVSLLALLVLASACRCSPSGSGSTAYGSGLPKVSATPSAAKQEREMFVRLNRDRRERGLPALESDARLADVARFHSADMRDNHFFAHESPTSGSLDDRLNAASYLFLTARENLAEAPDVQSGQDHLLRSPGHYANIIATDTTHVGIGIVPGGVEAPENLTITQVFAKPGRAETPAAAERALIDAIQRQRKSRGLGRAASLPLLEELAEQHITELDAQTSPESLEEVGKRITEAVTKQQGAGLSGLVVGAQLLPDSDSFEVPQSFYAPKARFGIAVRKPPGDGRPMLQVLFVVAR